MLNAKIYVQFECKWFSGCLSNDHCTADPFLPTCLDGKCVGKLNNKQ